MAELSQQWQRQKIRFNNFIMDPQHDVNVFPDPTSDPVENMIFLENNNAGDQNYQNLMLSDPSTSSPENPVLEL